MIRAIGITLLLLLVSACSIDGNGQGLPREPEENAVAGDKFPYEMEILANQLNVPWEMVFTPNGDILLTERPGQIRRIQEGKLVDEPVFRFEEPFISRGEGGLLGLEIDPNYSENGYLYAYHSYETGGQVKNRVLRLKDREGRVELDKILIADIPGDTNHNGGRIKFGPDGLLYITTGERYDPQLAQDLHSLGGKILRLHSDGSIPESNPFPDSPIYSWGHRNPQGLAWHPVTGKLYSSEHGQTAHDEINRIEPGGNYGWPEISGDEEREGMIRPLLHSGETTWAPSGMTFVSQGPWKDKLLVANLRGMQILEITFGGADYTSVEHMDGLFQQQLGRIRNVAEGPDGSLYIMTNNRDGRGTPTPEDDKLIRFRPLFES
ncbi:sorbosone dehydrogenase family protein [Paenibacillus sp. J2TS4]|uniref:PQQ-dependent sugar dehydrogenase n=1 Tax=Paenibacillus sp. J2TS4 TaxID=2807194 RepID=UPI001B2DC6E6|nr:PQQ-dependent sugar dehydrogenase [Paenibacillus sp. J2TS4]GIP35833.1 glucose sorbosone dehydrogenase [Paenibacillus sp. J2TS4]